MKRYLVKHYETANFGTLGGWSKQYFDTIQEAVAAAGKWGFIVDTTTDEDITIKAKEGTYNE